MGIPAKKSNAQKDPPGVCEVDQKPRKARRLHGARHCPEPAFSPAWAAVGRCRVSRCTGGTACGRRGDPLSGLGHRAGSQPRAWRALPPETALTACGRARVRFPGQPKRLGRHRRRSGPSAGRTGRGRSRRTPGPPSAYRATHATAKPSPRLTMSATSAGSTPLSGAGRTAGLLMASFASLSRSASPHLRLPMPRAGQGAIKPTRPGKIVHWREPRIPGRRGTGSRTYAREYGRAVSITHGTLSSRICRGRPCRPAC